MFPPKKNTAKSQKKNTSTHVFGCVLPRPHRGGGMGPRFQQSTFAEDGWRNDIGNVSATDLQATNGA